MDQYAVIGNPIGHSQSPRIHAGFAEATGQVLAYSTRLATPATFAATVREFQAAGGLGMNVTAPFKLQAFDLADETTERARRAGAVNALKFEDGLIRADNFDGIGLVADLQRNLGITLAGRRVLLLGAGGATRGALVPLAAQRPALLAIAHRDPAKARALATALAPDVPLACGHYDDFGDAAFDLVINATSASVKGELPPLSSRVYAAGALAYDLAYGQGLTPFLRHARDAGAQRLADGVGMLVEQAAEAFYWWRRIRPDTRAAIDRLSVALT